MKKRLNLDGVHLNSYRQMIEERQTLVEVIKLF